MKAEARGKYPGVKLHLDGEECKALLSWYNMYRTGGEIVPVAVPLEFTRKASKHIKELRANHPDMLKDRTDAKIRAALLRDLEKIETQLSALEKGKDWTQVKSELDL